MSEVMSSESVITNVTNIISPKLSGVKSPASALSWKDINVFVPFKRKALGVCKQLDTLRAPQPDDKQILHNVSGFVYSGTLLAIMGGSGAGKSTLLNVLTSRNVKNYIVSGEIHVDGVLMNKKINKMSAYVQQDDVFIETLTAREQLQFRALLRMDRKLKKTTRLARVEEVILEMGLSKCADSYIGKAGGSMKGLSGGERKRLSFASEALTSPPIFFCDEPTSGLDSFMARNVVNTMQKMAAGGHIILCTIHQPSSDIFAMFNKILILAEGRVAYMGKREKALEFFEGLQCPCPPNFNPADHYILTLGMTPGQEQESKENIKRICDHFLDSKEAKDLKFRTEELKQSATQNKWHSEAIESCSSYGASWFTQLRYLLWRSWICLFRNDMLFKVRLAQTVFIAILIGLVYLRLPVNQKSVMSINGAIFLLIINTSFANMMAVINTFPMELHVFFREYGAMLYRTDTYFLAKTVVETPFFMFVSVVFVSITYWMIGLNESMPAFLMCNALLVMVSLVAISLGYLISTSFGSVTLSLAVAPPLMTPFIMLGGLFINDEDIPFYFVWLKYISWFRYAYEVLMVNQWHGIEKIDCDFDSHTNTTKGFSKRCPYQTGDDILRLYSFEREHIVINVLALTALMVGFRTLSLITLVAKARNRSE